MTDLFSSTITPENKSKIMITFKELIRDQKEQDEFQAFIPIAEKVLDDSSTLTEICASPEWNSIECGEVITYRELSRALLVSSAMRIIDTAPLLNLQLFASDLSEGSTEPQISTEDKRFVTTILNAAKSITGDSIEITSPGQAQLVGKMLNRSHIRPQSAIVKLEKLPKSEDIRTAIRILNAVIAVPAAEPKEDQEHGTPLSVKGNTFNLPSGEEYRDTFNPVPKPTENEPVADNGILQLQINPGETFEITSSGNLKLNGEVYEITEVRDKLRWNPEYDKGLLLAVFTLRVQDAEQRRKYLGESLKCEPYTIDAPKLGEFLNRTYNALPLTPNGDTKTGSKRNLAAELTAFQRFFARVDGVQYALLTVQSIDPESQTIVVTTPAFDAIIRKNLRNAEKVKNGTGELSPYLNCLLTPSASKRNQAGFDMAIYLTNAMLRRGNYTENSETETANSPTLEASGNDSEKKNGGKVTYHCKVHSLISSSPTLKTQLENSKSTKNRNTVLERAFKSMYEILKNDSKCYSYFDNLKISETIPTSSTIETAKITASWTQPKGKK